MYSDFRLNLFKDRELEIFKLFGRGQNNREISQTLYLTEGTVKNYITNTFVNLKCAIAYSATSKIFFNII